MEVILIVGENAQQFSKILGVDDSRRLRLTTKYYDTSIPVHVDDSHEDPIGAIVVLDSLDSVSPDLPFTEDAVKILFSQDNTMLHRCIQEGFELVMHHSDENDLAGIERVLEALKCRPWTKRDQETTPDLGSFESLIAQMNETRNISNDSERRAKAESVARQFYHLFDNSSDSE